MGLSIKEIKKYIRLHKDIAKSYEEELKIRQIKNYSPVQLYIIKGGGIEIDFNKRKEIFIFEEEELFKLLKDYCN